MLRLIELAVMTVVYAALAALIVLAALLLALADA